MNTKNRKKTMITFSQNGRVGDTVYSLWYVKQFAQRIGSKVNYHLHTNVAISNPNSIDKTNMNSTVYMTSSTAQFITPFLQKCQFIEQVIIGDQVPVSSICLDITKEAGPINTFAGQMRQYFYKNDIFSLPREYWKPIIEVESNYKYKDKVLITLSQRYVNPLIDYKQLSCFKDILVFVGTEQEFNVFNKKYFKLNERIAPTSLLEVAELMKGALGYIANQTGFFAVAEALKVPRILFPAEFMSNGKNITLGPMNVLPLGGWCKSVVNKKNVINAVTQMINSSKEINI